MGWGIIYPYPHDDLHWTMQLPLPPGVGGAAAAGPP